MSADVDDEALSWGGETDSTHVDAPVVAEPEFESPEESAPRTGSALLIAYGVFAGILLLYIVGWIIAVQRDTFADANLLSEIMYKVGEFLAILSPALWFFGTLLLTRERKPGVRIVWLLIGILILAPWPFILAL